MNLQTWFVLFVAFVLRKVVWLRDVMRDVQSLLVYDEIKVVSL